MPTLLDVGDLTKALRSLAEAKRQASRFPNNADRRQVLLAVGDAFDDLADALEVEDEE